MPAISSLKKAMDGTSLSDSRTSTPRATSFSGNKEGIIDDQGFWGETVTGSRSAGQGRPSPPGPGPGRGRPPSEKLMTVSEVEEVLAARAEK